MVGKWTGPLVGYEEVEKWVEHANKRAPAVLETPVGVTNDLDSGADPRTVTSSESVQSQLKRALEIVFTPNKFERVGTLYGILLRQNSPYSKDDPYTPLDILHQATFAMCGSNKYRQATYKIRIPELHFMLPIPKNPLNPSETDQIIIDCYPTVQAIDTAVMKQQVRPGDIVKVEMANKGAISRLYYSGPADADGTTLPWIAGPSSPPYNYGQLLEECKKKYSNAGSRGDMIGKGENLVKINSGAPLIIRGVGITENKIITGTVHKKWLFDLFQGLKSQDKYKGLVWLGVCENNGPEDQELMLSNDGLKLIDGAKPGRSAVIYMPSSTDPSSPLEIIYWFHDSGDFKNSPVEWNKLWGILSGMSKKKSTLGGARRNFVFVVPEMLWSEEASGMYFTRSGKLVYFKDKLKPTRYRNREWAAWGFNGIPAVPSSTKLNLDASGGGVWKYPDAPHDRVDIPFDFQPLQDPWKHVKGLPKEVAGDMVLLHEEILGTLKDQFGVPDTTTKFVTLMGHKKGGIAIGNLARMNKLGKGDGQLYASKISFVHGDYAGQNNISDSTIQYGKNWFHGGDLHEVVKKIDTTTKLEIHLAWGPGHDKPPTDTAAAFVGGLLSAISWGANEAPTWTQALAQLEAMYQYIWGLFWPASWVQTYSAWGNTYDAAADHIAPIAGLFEEAFTEGLDFIKGKTNSAAQLPPPFSNIVYKGWPGAEAIGALAWLPPDIPTSIATVQEESALASMEKTHHLDDNVPDKIKDIFKGFDGQVILYASEKVGPSKTVAILVPKGASQRKNYELIYYLHGDLGLNGSAKIFQPALKNQFNIMVKAGRNVVIVLADIDPNPINPSSTLWGLGSDPDAKPPTYTFSEFHKEVIDKMVEKWQPTWMELFGGFGPGSPQYTLWEKEYDLLTPFDSDPDDGKVAEHPGLNTAPYETAHYAQQIPVENLVASPSFITIKAHNGGSRMLRHIAKDMNNKNLHATRTTDQWESVPVDDPTAWGSPPPEQTSIIESWTTPIRRIDLLNANWGPEYGIMKQIYNIWPADTTKPGEEFEIQMVAGPHVFGAKKVPAIVRAEKYMPGEKDAKPGLWVIPTEAPNATLPFKFFSSPSKLNMSFPEIPSSQGGADATPTPSVPLKFDKKGKAYDLTGKRMPKYDLKKEGAFVKGFLKNHTPSTEQIGGTMGCEVLSRKTYGLTKVAVMTPAEGIYKCKTNPLGLLNFKKQRFHSIKISPTRSEYSWGSAGLSEYLKGLDNILWTQTGEPTTWVVKDISPQGTNGVDKVQGHDSHREGIDIDVLLPQLNLNTSPPTPLGEPSKNKKVVLMKELDVDKTLVFMILSKFYGAKVIFLDKKFFKRIRDRATFIAADGTSSGPSEEVLKVDKAFKTFLKENLFGKLDFVNQLMALLKHKKHHESHFHVRIGREWGSHETSDYPKWAIRRLKSLGCDYKSSSII